MKKALNFDLKSVERSVARGEEKKTSIFHSRLRSRLLSTMTHFINNGCRSAQGYSPDLLCLTAF